MRGSVDLPLLRSSPGLTPIGELADGNGALIAADDGLDQALGTLADQRLTWAPVVADGRLVGIISTRDAMTAYRAALAGNVRQVRGLGAGGVLLEGDLPAASPLVGHTVAEAGWPRGVVVVAIQRGGELLVPGGATELRAGDRVTVFASPDAEAGARVVLGTDLGV